MKDKMLLALFCATVVFHVFCSPIVRAQNSLNIPYSQFGLGLSGMPYNVPSVARLGGVAYTRSAMNGVNPFNPASYGSIATESFVFDMGLGIQYNTLCNESVSRRYSDGNLAYLSVGLPLTKWWKMAAGLMPYTSVQYASVAEQQGEGYGTMKTVYDGDGGISMVYGGMAFNLLGDGRGEGRQLQAGFNVNYLTGSINRAVSYSFQHVDSTHYMNSRRYKKTTAGNVLLDFGVQYREPLNEKYTLGVGLVYKPHMKSGIDDDVLIYTYHTSDQSLADTVFPQRGQSSEIGSTVEQAGTVGVGLSLERNRSWMVALDATFGSWSGMKYTEGMATSFLGQSQLTYGPFQRYALALEKTGNMDARTYWGRISWSAGVHFEKGAMHMMVGGAERSVDEWGFGLGTTLPMRQGRSGLTLSVSYSLMGQKDLLQYNCLSFGISVSTSERWFVKRKYN